MKKLKKGIYVFAKAPCVTW